MSMTNVATAKICTTTKTYKGERVYERASIIIPQELFRDPAFPFKAGDRVIIRIQGRQLVMEALQ